MQGIYIIKYIVKDLYIYIQYTCITYVNLIYVDSVIPIRGFVHIFKKTS